MIAVVRAVFRAGAISVFLLLWSIGFGLVRPFTRGTRRERWRRGFFGGAARALLVLFGARMKVEGVLPSRPGFLVSNHLGYFDVLVIGAICPCVFVSRDDVAGWPFIGPLTRWAGTIYIDRTQKAQIPSVLSAMRAAMAHGDQVVFFPEGTSGSGAKLLPFRPSLFEVAARTGAPVHCASLHYATVDGDPSPAHSVAWWGDMEFGPHAWTLLKLARIDVTVRFSEVEIQSSDRKEIARRAEVAVREIFTALDGAPESEGLA